MRPKRSRPVEGDKPAVAEPDGDRERPGSATFPGDQSYPASTLSDAEKAYLDFLVDKAIEAWLKR